MHVTVEVVGGEEYDLDLGPDATYADLIRDVGYSPQEASALVDGSPVPDDSGVNAERVQLLRLVKGGSEPPSTGDDLDFQAPNPGAGASPYRLSASDAALVLVLFHRDFLCGNCRKQVEAVCERYDAFADMNAEVVSVLPEPTDKAAAWVDYHEAPFPILADPDNEIAEQYGQRVRLGTLGRKFDLLGRMPLAVIVDVRRKPELLWQHVGSTPTDRPDVEDLLSELRKFA